MAVNLPEPGAIAGVPGVSLASAAAFIKEAAFVKGAAAIEGAAVLHSDRDDLTLLSFAPTTSVAAVFTRSSFRAAPVILAEQRIRAGKVTALLINSGNANAATGEDGLIDAETLCRAAANALDLPTDAVAPFSTGVIGERLPVDRMLPVICELPAGLKMDGWLSAGRAIMTTDTVAKVRSAEIHLAGAPITITGMAKGSGMIRPDMATMLAFICCDAVVEAECLQTLLSRVVAGSFNRISVDGDTSTNDSLVLAATGVAGMEPISNPDSAAAAELRDGIEIVAIELAQAIVRDGEGATKFVTVRVVGGSNEAECLQVAYTVAESPLVKTALFASDPNWGRLAMAIGRAGVVDLDVSGVDVWFDEVQVMAGGLMAPGYRETDGADVMALAEFTIRINLGRGAAAAEIWTSDLSYDYVRINAEYRT